MLLAVVQAVATAIPTVTPTVTPVVAPVAQVASNGLLDQLNALVNNLSTADLLVAAGVAATCIQYLINRYANVRKWINWILSFSLPFIVLLPAGFIDDLKKLAWGPVVYLLAQVTYFTVERLRASSPAVEPTLPAGV